MRVYIIEYVFPNDHNWKRFYAIVSAKSEATAMRSFNAEMKKLKMEVFSRVKEVHKNDTTTVTIV